jgi:rubrerythrin
MLTKLKASPPPIGSTDQLMAIAHAMEKEAARRYRELAARMRLRREDGLAALFDFLASIEDKHAAHIDRRATEALGRSVSAERVSWEVPENFDEEEGSSRLLTPYRALAVAVRNEERAFAFYSYVAANAPNEQSRILAEEFAKDELAHAWLLRRERRKAYRQLGADDRPRDAELPGSLDELWELAAEAEWRAATYHRSFAELLERRGEPGTSFAEAADDEEACAREAAQRLGRGLAGPSDPVEPSLDGALRLLEEAFERYADIVDRSKVEDVMHEAQSLAARALRRLNLVRGGIRNMVANVSTEW